MDLEIVTIGTELLLGLTIDTNAAALARALTPVGAFVVRKTTVGDDQGAIGEAVREGLLRTGLVITSGGLGPTKDDRTKRAVADLFGVPLLTDRAYLASLEDRWRQLARPGPMPVANRTQAEIPQGAVLLPNPRGTAPGLWLEGEPGVVVLLPGVPHEFKGLVAEEVVPRLAARTGASRVTMSRVLRTTGVAESALADRLEDLEATLDAVTLAYLPSVDGVDLRLTAWGVAPEAATGILDLAARKLRPVLAADLYGEGETDLAQVVLARLANAGKTLTVAESCTGGLLGARITAIPGSSAVFVGGVIAYADTVKRHELGVPQTVLARHGAVSEETVRAMAHGAAARFEAGVAVAVSGVAGPDGGTSEKPVGTVWLATVVDGRDRVVRLGLPGGRQEIRARAAQAALDLVRRQLGRVVGTDGRQLN